MGRCRGKVHGALGGCLWASCRDPQVRHPQQLGMGFLIQPAKLLIGSAALWYIPLWALTAVFPVTQFTTWYFGWSRKELGLFGGIPYTGEGGHSLTYFHLPPQEKSQAKVSFGTELCLGGGATQIKWNCPCYPLHCVQSQIYLFIFFPPMMCWN